MESLRPFLPSRITTNGISAIAIPIPTSRSIVTAFCIYLVYRLVTRYTQQQRVIKRAKQFRTFKQQQQKDVEQQIRPYMTDEITSQHRAILALTATQAIQKMKTGELSVSSVVDAICYQALRSHSKYNCITENVMLRAKLEATTLDTMIPSQRTTMPLFGLPISFKDSLNIKGYDSTLGVTRYVNQPAEKDALIVEILSRAGAIPYVKTSIPQTLISFECVNPLFGLTTNPYNTAYTPGGSSGGESVLLATRGSFVGIGTDIGGSVRIPAHFMGHYAIKPTSRRISTQGFRASVPGQEAIAATAGVMSNSVDDIALVLRELWVPAVFERDHEVIPMVFDDKEYSNDKLLRVGYFMDDGVIAPTPAIVRAMEETIAALKQAGHYVAPFQPPRPLHALELYYACLSADHGKTITNQLVDEVWEDYVTTLMTGLRSPVFMKRIIAYIARHILKDPKAARLVSALRERTTAEMWNLQYERKKYRQEFYDAWHAENAKFDIVLCPVNPLPAVKHGAFKDTSFTVSYTAIYNLLDYPAGVVPVTTVRSTDVYTAPRTSLLERKVDKHYDPISAEGLPVGIQVVAPALRDETVLRGMRIIQQLIPFKVMPKQCGLATEG